MYTNCTELELILNGKSFGRKAIEKYGHGEWELVYEPGEIVAVAYSGGKEVARDRVATTGKAVALELEMQTEALFADVYDCAVLHCYAVDENGNRVPDAAPYVSFDCNNLGIIAATGSDIIDHKPPHFMDRQMRAGAISVLVTSTGNEGKLVVYAKAEGLKSARIEIEVTQPNDEQIR